MSGVRVSWKITASLMLERAQYNIIWGFTITTIRAGDALCDITTATHCSSGTVTIADSHFLSNQLRNRLVGAYFLGCPMTYHIRDSVMEIMAQQLTVTGLPKTREYVVKV